MNKTKLIALIGKSGAGKDTLLESILMMDKKIKFNKIISYTTRPPRKNEINGVDYNFIDMSSFNKKISNEEMLEWTSFRGWKYGTALDSIQPDAYNIGIFNPDAVIRLLTKKDKIDILIIYVEATDKIRLIRQLKREENPDIEEIIRRYRTDQIDFFDIASRFDTYSILNNGDRSIGDVADDAVNKIKEYFGCSERNKIKVSFG